TIDFSVNVCYITGVSVISVLYRECVSEVRKSFLAQSCQMVLTILWPEGTNLRFDKASACGRQGATSKKEYTMNQVQRVAQRIAAQRGQFEKTEPSWHVETVMVPLPRGQSTRLFKAAVRQEVGRVDYFALLD
ncbi:MAG: hypothetical protein Q7R48_03205, partial [bacterium]|nr:hypothetical protein [bacterium]